MNKKEIMSCFIDKIYKNNLMTLFIKNVFDYEDFNDYNYLFRMKEDKDSIVIDIYDNISDNRFNRYIFYFYKGEYDIKVLEEGNVFVSYIYIYNVEDSDNKLLKLAYLFKLDKIEMIRYSKTFLSLEIVMILNEVL